MGTGPGTRRGSSGPRGVRQEGSHRHRGAAAGAADERSSVRWAREPRLVRTAGVTCCGAGGAWHGMKDGGRGGGLVAAPHTKLCRRTLDAACFVTLSYICLRNPSDVDSSEGGSGLGGGGGVQQCHGDRLGKNPPPPPGLALGLKGQPTTEGWSLACSRVARTRALLATGGPSGRRKRRPRRFRPAMRRGGRGARGRKVHSPSGETVGGIILGGVWRFYRWPKRSFKAEMII